MNDGPSRRNRIAVVGAGVGGLAAAIDLARGGLEVVVLERAAGPGGKMREDEIGDVRLDAGPTVMTMRSVFDDLFADAGARLDEFVTLRPLETLARHTWDRGSDRDRVLDLHADRDRTADAIGDFAGAAEAIGYRRFCDRSREVFATLEKTFIHATRPSVAGLVLRGGLHGLPALMRISPFATLWGELGRYFADARLRQLFGRYATYCGSSPFLSPATLMLVAHVEQQGVFAVEGGMYRLAKALETLARRLGVVVRYDAQVQRIETNRGRVTALALADGDRLEVDAIISNADVAALASGAFGSAAARAVPSNARARSLSALTFAIHARTSGFPLQRHNVFFNDDYRAEFDDIFAHGRLPRAPTIYVCAQDRRDATVVPAGSERLLCIVNAPALGDEARPNAEEIDRCRRAAFAMLDRCGLRIETPNVISITGPQEFERLFPATGGALYGQASHGWRASFTRPSSRTKIRGLYLAGGSTHPGAGVPTSTISGRLAAAALMRDLRSGRGRASPGMSGRTAMRGGTSTH